MDNASQKENSPGPDKENDLIKSLLCFEEKSNEESDINFEKFLEELKKESIDYEVSNNEIQNEAIKNTKTDLDILKKQSKVKAEGKDIQDFKGEKIEKGDVLISHGYLMRRKFRQGRALHKSGYYKKAKKLFKESAEGGCMEGMHCLAIVYINCEGCKKSIKKASYWATMAIQNGDLKAKQTLDNILYEAEAELYCLIF